MKSLKRAKRVEAQNKAFEMYLKLKEAPQGSCVEEDVLLYLLKNMELRREVPATLLGIIEVLRINAPKCFLSREEKQRFFRLLVETLPEEKINLETFITYRIPSLLTDKALISKLAGLTEVVSGTAKKYLKEIMIILIEEGTEDSVREVVRAVLLHIPKDPTFNTVIEVTKEISMPAVAILMESFEDKVYADVYSSFTLKECLCVRNIKGQGKLKYLTAAMSEKNFEKLCSFYIGDRDKKVIKILAENCSAGHEEIFYRIVNDCDEDVRMALLERISFEDVVEHSLDIYERILDTSHKVREVVFNIFRSGMLLHKDSLLKIAEGSKENKENGSRRTRHEAECLLKFVKLALKGIFTSQRKAYVELLNECNLPWEFYFHIKSFKGVTTFLSLNSERMKEENAELPECEERRRFYLEYFFSGKIPKQRTLGLIETDIPSALAYLRGKADLSEYAELLINKALASSNVKEILMIIEVVKPYLTEKIPLMCPKSNAELLVYAHSKHSSYFSSQVLDFEISFPMLYFLSHMKMPVDVLLPLLLEYKGSMEEYVEIQLAHNSKRLLQEFTDYFMEINLDEDSKTKLVKSKTFVGSMIYFLNTGQVSIRNTDFFISSICLVCAGLGNEPKVKYIYETYSMKVDQITFNKFYTICSRLKTMSLNKEPYQIDEGKVIIKKNDKTLFLICETVLNARAGEISNERFNLNGFYPISEDVLSVISLGRMI
ncbi:sister chromatid cohesion protein PDS5 [Encephalitozoon hellem]|uniref:Sister chromatid cohesion protein PDS5 n=1 Tax=Encephalitozoon hellem TaxID=27973 RepID=A0ABY8CLX5_ENCHE|nr:sister chromatid cohesion protein PDS5 [Encephalitozoon hellem]